jgi:hypothetical protein
MQTMKMAVILLVGGHLFDAGHRDDHDDVPRVPPR